MPAGEEKKKRKSRAPDDARPKKKQAISNSEKPISVSFVDDTSTWQPIFAKSPGLQLSKKTVFTPFAKEEQAQSTKSAKLSSRILLHSGSHPRLDYTAAEAPSETVEGGLRHYVGVYDPSNSTLKVIPARQTTVQGSLKHAFVVDQKLAAAEESQAAGQANESAASKHNAARIALGQEFGTKKAQKAIRSAAANAVSSPAVGQNGVVPVTNHMQAVLESANMTNGTEDAGDRDERKATLTELVNDAHPRPTPNLDAERPADIYRLTQVIGKQELDLIDVSDWMTMLRENQPIETTSRFVSSRVHRAFASGDRAAERNLKALRFLLALLQWRNALESRGSSMKLPKKEKMDEKMQDFNKELLRKIKQKFAPSGTSLNAWDIQRLHLHACAIAIVVDGFTTDLHDLQEDLRVTSSEIRSLFKQLGCKVEAPSEKEMAKRNIPKAAAPQHHIAKLRLPFTLPEVRQRRVVQRR